MNPQVAHAALIGLFDRCEDFPREAIFRLAENGDSFVRQTAVQLLAEKASLAELQQLSESTRSPARLAGVLALGFRLTVPQSAKPLADNFPLNPKGFNAKVQYADGIENLAAHARLGVFTIADAWAKRAGNSEVRRSRCALLRR